MEFSVSNGINAPIDGINEPANGRWSTDYWHWFVVFDGMDYLRAAAQPITAVDTNGAGDMFAGAYLYGITQGYSNLSAAVFANRAASAVVGQYGPRLHSAEYHGLKEGLK